jgi:hypothetical protein
MIILCKIFVNAFFTDPGALAGAAGSGAAFPRDSRFGVPPLFFF